MDNIISAILGGVLGWVINELLNPVKRKAQKAIKEKSTKKALFSKEITKGFIALENAIPYYKKDNLHLYDSGACLFISIPNKYKKSFNQKKIEMRESVYLDGSTNLLQAIDKLGVLNPKELLKDCVEEVALIFNTDLENGFMRFNGLMYGVKKVRNERLTLEEEAGLDVLFYKTDYFTFRVFAKIYEKLNKNESSVFKVEKLQDLNSYSPFLSGFGLGTFIIINQGKGDEIILGRRSSGVVVDKGKWHFSMNEALSMKDVDEYGQPSLSACLFRGLQEELGISQKYKKYIKQYEFLDFILNPDRFEIGITSFVRIELTNEFTLKNLMEFYSIAQDGKLETSTIISLPINEIDEFIKKNDSDISSVCKGAIKALSTRYKAGYLRDDL